MTNINNCEQISQLVTTNSLKFSGDPSICKINVSKYSIDHCKTFNPDGYTIICRLGEACNGLSFFPETSTIILDSNQQTNLVNNFENLIPGIAQDLAISQEAALEKTFDFFSNSVVHVQPTGIQGKVYSTMKSLQNYVPFSYTLKAISIAKTTGITGFKIIVQAPLTFVGATYVGSLFFGYAGCVAGNNTIGVVCNATSYLLSRPMRGVEITLNGLILRPISNIIGLPLVLNGTQEILTGEGLSLQEYTKIGLAFERICNSTVIKKATKIYKILRNKD